MKLYSRYIIVICSLIWLLTCGNLAAQHLPSNHYKYKVILSVCQKIAAAKGDIRKRPELEVISKSSSQLTIAQFKWQPVPKIIVDERLYDVCKTFDIDSLDALACIIGHELAHYYENHKYPTNFADLKDFDPVDSINSQTSQIRLEGEADYFGLFYGFLAGYDTFRVLPKALEAIYKEYNLTEQLPGYPTKAERLNIAKKSIEEIRPLAQVFQAGQFLYLKKNFKEAAICFNYLLTRYPGREIYNNSGVATLAQAIELMDVEELYFAYPFELDADSRLQKSTIRSAEDKVMRQQKIDNLLLEAQHNFEKTIASDESYLPGYINLASVYSLQNNQEAAIGKIKELERVCLSNQQGIPGNASLIKGIAKVKMGQIEAAEENFEQALDKKAYLAQYNLDLYKKIHTSWRDKLGNWLTHWPVVEDWIHSYLKDEKKSTTLNPEKMWEDQTRVTLANNNKVSSILISDEHTPVKIVSAENLDNNSFTIQLTDYSFTVFSASANYNGKTTAGINIGSSLSNVIKKYGKPTYTTSNTNGLQNYFYEGARIIFKLKDDIVIGWNCYSISY
jgi:hypothetical protein